MNPAPRRVCERGHGEGTMTKTYTFLAVFWIAVLGAMNLLLGAAR